MSRVTAPRAVLTGIGVLVFAQVLYVGVLIKIGHHELLRWILLGAPGFAACITAYLSINRKLLMGVSMALYGVMIGILSTIGYDYFGMHVDRIGGLQTTFAVLLAYYAALSVVGSMAGIFLSRLAKRIWFPKK